MNEKNLLRMALFCGLVGIFLILFISERMDLSASNIGEITLDKINEKVKIKGEIYSIINTPGLAIIKIRDLTGEITIIAFKEENLELKKGNIIGVQGRVIEYKNKIEIEAEIISLI